MTNKKRPDESKWRDLCADWQEDDGVHPHEQKKDESRKADHHKTKQLARQIREALQLAWRAVCRDVVLCDLTVLSVEPAPDASRFLVIVGPALPGRVINPSPAQMRIEELAGKLRAEVAVVITRKRAPNLIFEVRPTSGEVTS